jgi:hypothetical protein
VASVQFPATTALLRRATARHGLKMDDPKSAAQIEKFIETYGVNVDEVELSVSSATRIVHISSFGHE